MHPTLVDLGFLHLRTYGVLVAAGFLLCWHIIERISGRKDLSNLLVSLMVAGITGARAAYVIENWSGFSKRLADIIRIDQGGLVFYGGLILALCVFAAWCIIKKENVLSLADLCATVVPLGHAFGRLGCFFYGCCYGRLSDSLIAVSFPMHSPAWYEQLSAGLIPPTARCSLPVLPTQLFEAAALLVLFAVTLSLYVKFNPKGAKPKARGIVAGAYLCIYAVMRFALEYLRGDPRAEVGPLSIAQTISFAIFATGLAFLVASRFTMKTALRKEIVQGNTPTPHGA